VASVIRTGWFSPRSRDPLSKLITLETLKTAPIGSEEEPTTSRHILAARGGRIDSQRN